MSKHRPLGIDQRSVTCRERSQKWVHAYAAGGAVLAAAPVPGTSLMLGAAETHMIYWIAKIYGENLSVAEIAAVAGGLELAGLGLKALAMEAMNFVPILGSAVKSVIAGGAIEGIGALIIDHYEDKYPDKLYTADPSVEARS